jgi:AcrR family transcriptional regulator
VTPERTDTATAAPAPDRRQRRRQETIDEILRLALAQMADVGVGALSLSTVAREMGIRPPSLYQYFPSRLAVYDELFRRGNEELNACVAEAVTGISDPVDRLRSGSAALTRWSVEHPVIAQLMFWRPVPGFEPSPESFAPALAQVDLMRDVIREAVDAGALAPEAATDDGFSLFTVWVSGVVSQQMANEPDAPFDSGRFTRLFDRIFDTWVLAFTPAPAAKGRRS